jgi:peptidase M48-like protein
VAETGRLRRAEFAVAAFGSTAFLLALVFVLDAVRFHHDVLVDGVEGLWHGRPHPGHTLILGLALFDLVALARVALSLSRGVSAHRRFIARLPLRGERDVGGRRVTVLAGPRAMAFCGGLLRPRIYLSEGALARLGEAELAAIVAHEAHHAARRDPLRILGARAIGDAFGRREQALADLSADAYAVRRVGDGPLAAALLAFHADQAGIAAVRVDQLTGDAPRAEVPRPMAIVAGVVVVALVAELLWTLAVPGHPKICVPLSSAPAVALLARLLVMTPAWLGLRRVTALLAT